MKLKYVGIVFGVILVAGLIFSIKVYGRFLRAVFSVQKIEENFYFMEFEGDYGFERFMRNGGADTNDKMALFLIKELSGGFYSKVKRKEYELKTGCSFLFTENSENTNSKKTYLSGRNYDWNECNNSIIIHTKPKNAYESISTTQLHFLGFGDDFKPESFFQKYLSIASIYVPLDGMNEKGLCIVDLSVDDDFEQTHQKRGKTPLTITTAIRGILDYCATVDEAIKFLDSIDMNSVIGFAHHFAISDNTGKSVVVEYVNNEMIVTETKIVSNHYINKIKPSSKNENSLQRFEALNQNSIKYNNFMNEDELKNSMKNAKASSYSGNSQTIWTIIYNQNELKATYYFFEDYDNPKKIIKLISSK